MRVCLVSSVNLSSWFNRESEPVMLSLPLGVLSIAAVLEEKGHSVKIIDFNYALAGNEISLGNNFYESTATKILDYKPELVGFSTMCNSYHIALRIAEAVKAKAPDILVIFGGPQASVADVETLSAFPFVDIVLRGEAEASFPRLLSVLSSRKVTEGVKGLTCRAEGRIVRFSDEQLIADLDSLPMPAYHLFPYKIESPVPLDTGRGCPFDCSFCSTSTFWKRHFRMKSISRIIQEVQDLKSRYAVDSFSFMHDSFTVNKHWLTQFCNRLDAEKMAITWTCSARIDCVDPQLLQLMAKVGCQAVFYGVETGSERMQETIGKKLQLKNVPTIVDATLNAKMGATLSFISGFPEEQEADLAATMNLIQTLLNRDINIQLHLLAPQVGTREYANNFGKLGFDGYYSDIAGATSKFLELDWFEQYPKLFASFHFFRNDNIPRDFLKGIDLFIQGPVAVLRGTILSLLESEGNLLNIYCDWRKWAKSKGLDAEWHEERTIDKLLMDFYEFASAQVAEGKANFDTGQARDEILAFYIRQYNQTPVRFVTIKDKESEEQQDGMERK